MPLYAYRCTQCGHRFEKIQSFSAEPETRCPQCGNDTLIRPLTAPALQFKGAGWYVNDYSSKGSSATDSSSTESAKPAAESKPAATEASSKPASTDTASKAAVPPATNS